MNMNEGEHKDAGSPCRDIELISSLITEIPDFPQPGILFRDIFPVLRNPVASEMLISRLLTRITTQFGDQVDSVAALDARGFLFGPILAMRLKASFVPIRKVCLKVLVRRVRREVGSR